MPNKRDIISELRTAIQQIRSEDKKVNTQPGSLINDTILIPLTDMVFKQRVRSQLISVYQSMESLLDLKQNEDLLNQTAEDLQMSPNELESEIVNLLEKLAANWDVERRSATTATGFVLFYKEYDENETQEIIIPEGTIVSKIDDTDYKTKSEITLTSDSPYSNILNTNYEEVEVECTESGTVGNAAERTITIFSGIEGIDGVINLNAIDNGLDEQSDEGLVETVENKLSGNNIGVEDGYRTLIFENFNYVDEVYPVGPNDDEMERNEFGGGIDIYIKGSFITETTDTFSKNADDEYVLKSQPVVKNQTITANGFSNPDDFQLEKDTNIYRNSVEATDKIINFVDAPDEFDIEYKYNRLIEDIQSFLEKPENKVINANVLVKQAIEITADIELKIDIFSGYSPSSTENEIENILGEHIIDLGLNDDLLIANIIDIVQEIEAVKNTYDVRIKKNDGSFKAEDLPVDKTSYITAGGINVV